MATDSRVVPVSLSAASLRVSNLREKARDTRVLADPKRLLE